MKNQETPVKNPHAGHRKRLRERYVRSGMDDFADHEVIELLLTYAIPRVNVNEQAHALIERFGSVAGVLDASVEELCEIGVKLGADVPFCIVGGCAVAEGIGEVLTPTVGLAKDSALVVACMGEGVSTPWAYGELDRLFDGFSQKRTTEKGENLVTSLQNGATNAVIGLDCYNVFEHVVPQIQPYVDRIKSLMKDNGATVSMMSGSGPSVFGLFETIETASDACEKLRQMGADAFVCHPCAGYAIK
jgi:4-diphosphocytidyl-2C-methyl-D-erythritol kinase